MFKIWSVHHPSTFASVRGSIQYRCRSKGYAGSGTFRPPTPTPVQSISTPASQSRPKAPSTASSGEVGSERAGNEAIDDGVRRRASEVNVIPGLSFALAPGEAMGLVGESGCGKSTVALSIVIMLALGGAIVIAFVRHARRPKPSLVMDPRLSQYNEQIEKELQNLDR